MPMNFHTLFSLSCISLKYRQFNLRPCFSFSHQSVDNFVDLNCDNQVVHHNHQIHVFDASSLYTSLINSSTQITHLNQIHTQLIISGIHSKEANLVSKFMNVCFNMGEIGYACKVFDEYPEPNVCMWNAIFRGYCESNMWGDLIELYARMQRAGVSANCDILSRVLKACSWLQLLEMGGAIHGHIFRIGYECDVFIQTCLFSLYAECGNTDDAKNIVAHGLLYGRRSAVVAWTAIISKLARKGCSMEALRLFIDMRLVDMKPDWITLVSVLRACADLDYLEQGKSLHGCVLKMGLESEEDLRISLTAMYAKCGQVMVARLLFDQMDEPNNLTLWNAMISGYAKNGYAEEAIELFKLLATKKNIKPDTITVRAAILACAQVGSLDLAKWINGYVSSGDYWNHMFVKTALIDMYAKCGSVELARQVFNGIRDKDVVVWSAMIVGYGLHGRGQEAIDLYDSMIQAQVRPNDVTFLGLLTACKNSYFVKEGWDFFHSMKDHGLQPHNQHYACVVDLLGRAGYLGEAYKFIVRMPIEPGLTVWGALLNACKIHRHVKMGEYAAAQLFAIDPYDTSVTGHYVQLSNLYAAARMWDQVNEVRKLMKERGLIKDFGFSLIEINGKLQVFRVGDNSHPKSEEIWKELIDLERRLKEAGFFHDTESNLHELSCEEMQESLCNHSERLAVAYGLISTPSGSSLRIIKNLRACVNCHSAIKLISKITNREIIVRDANRFHHFKDGVCSCGDYW